MKLLYQVRDSQSKPLMKVPVEVVDGSTVKRFGRKDCKIRPIGGEGEMSTNMDNLEIRTN